MTLSHRLAQPSDLDALRAVMALAIAELQKGFLDDAQIAASHAVKVTGLSASFRFLQHADDLFFRKPRTLHLSVLPSRPDSNQCWRKIRGSRQLIPTGSSR